MFDLSTLASRAFLPFLILISALILNIAGASAPLISVFLIIWGLFTIRRLILLTNMAAPRNNPNLPHRLLLLLGAEEQKKQENIILGLLSHAHFLLTIALALTYFILCVWFGGGLAALNLPLLIASVFFHAFLNAAQPDGAGERQDHGSLSPFFSMIAVFILVPVFFFQIINIVYAPSSFEIRANIGGFWYASLPYILYIHLLFYPFVNARFLRRVFRSIGFAALSVIGISLALLDMGQSATPEGTAVALIAWSAAGYFYGRDIFQTYRTFTLYQGLRSKLANNA